MDNTATYIGFFILVAVLVGSAVLRTRRREKAAIAAAHRAGLSTEGPRAQHPRIDISHCIGCGACVDVCPEDVLAVIAGKAAIASPAKCIGHGLCAEACPVGAIEIVMAKPSIGADLPALSRELETNVPNLFVVGELGGLALIKNAVNQGRDVVDTIAERFARRGRPPVGSGAVDVCIVGAGPGGISAALRATERKLSYLILEQEEFGGTVARYPRQKLVLTSPVEFPGYGKFKKLQLSKEDLLKFWDQVRREANLSVRTQERVERVEQLAAGGFTVRSTRGAYPARSVVLALGRRGSPRKLGVPGEDLPKVMYSLLDAEAYTDARVLVVGGGDSAVETAMGLAHQRGNTVTLSYRKEAFTRIKERNAQRVRELAKSGKLKLLFNSQPVAIRPQAVVLEVAGQPRELPNDYVWVLAGSLPPNEFLRQAGVQLGARDLTEAARAEASVPA
ncbi:MAG TPA: NAD(P)-binding domain-containing protein [Gemmatimonadales bacterium]|nr:NAD(P)-binding domain-containing protein [Gemmatimonadales bacterium]